MDQNEKKIDRRVVKTKKAIKNAFARLLTEKDINDITISNIADYADVNRKTFYNYYRGVYDVVDEIENDIINRIDAALSGADVAGEIDNPYIVFEKLTEVINTDMDFFGVLLSMNGNVSLVTKITGLVKEKAKSALQGSTGMDDRRLSTVLEFTISGMMAVYQQWFNSDRTQSIDEISEVIGSVVSHGIGGAGEVRL